MATLIVDIETFATPWGELPSLTRSALTQWIERGGYTDDEEAAKKAGVKAKLALSPFTARIISLAMYDVERAQGAVYYASDEADTFTVDDYTFKARTEEELLLDFWESAKSYDTFVTFNGRSFTLPFLYHRSAINGLKPSVDIAQQRYVTKQAIPYHVDLLDEFSFHGNMSNRPSLQLLCGAYGVSISSLLAGEEIAEAFTEGRVKEIAEKNAGDVSAIFALYDIWKNHLAPRAFINAVENL